MKVGLAQINTIVGDLPGNLTKIRQTYEALVSAGAELVVFPELALTGYPPRDLLLKSRFVADSEATLRELAGEAGEAPLVTGCVLPNTAGNGRRFRNAAAWCEHGEIRAVAHKLLLPTYDVFDEDRYFHPGDEPCVVEYRSQLVGLSICEDIWTHPDLDTRLHYTREPLRELARAGIDLLLNLSASPWTTGKTAFRHKIVENAARAVQAPVVYVNAVGGNDELIFDGHSVFADAKGELRHCLPGFAEEAAVADTEAATGCVQPADHPLSEIEEVRRALVLGLRDYAQKTGFSRALLGLSGGIDSALTAALAVEAFGAENVTGILLPSAISSEHSKSDAAALARNFGMPCHTIAVNSLVEAAGQALEPFFAGTEPGVAEENIQSRARGLLLMALSNKWGALLLSTGNKSEMAVGYCTLYGDMNGGLAVLSDVPKTLVYRLAAHINEAAGRELIPHSTLTKAPSAELRPDQKDEDSLPPYDILDDILRQYVEEHRSRAEIVASGHDAAVVDEVARKVDLNEYKRKQAAPGLKVTPLAFGVGRRLPIVQRYIS